MRLGVTIRDNGETTVKGEDESGDLGEVCDRGGGVGYALGP